MANGDNYRTFIQDSINKSEELFEQKITYISAGALVLSLTLIDKVIPFTSASSITFLVLGWCLLGGSLLANLSSHLISKYLLKRTQNDVDEDIPEDQLHNNIKQRNNIISWVNWACLIILISGIISIIVFASKNAYSKSLSQEKPLRTMVVKK
jgi:hypothetical protein